MPRILIIDDDEVIRTLLKRALEGEGFEVSLAPDGRQGLKLFRQKGADLVITDMIMPGKGGMETIMELREEWPEAKIIAISGGDSLGPQPYLEVVEGFGAVRIFSKPFDVQELLKAVKEMLR